MKKILLVAILMAAAGGALYYFLETKKPKRVSNLLGDHISGTWKIDSVSLTPKDTGNVFGLFIMAIDSNYLKYTYTFSKDGSIEKKLGDSTIPEKINYVMKDSSQLVFIAGDSTKEEFSNKIISFNNNQFTVLATDSSILYFKRQ
jgi:hypothetical protein